MSKKINKSFEELAEQATRRYDRLGCEIPFAQPDLELFAKLIVQECALTLYKSAVRDKQAGFAHEAKVMELAGHMIKQHFGIKE